MLISGMTNTCIMVTPVIQSVANCKCAIDLMSESFHLSSYNVLSNSRKYPYPYHGQLFRFPNGRGGSRLWNFEGMGGNYNWKSEGLAWGDFTGGISGVESVE